MIEIGIVFDLDGTLVNSTKLFEKIQESIRDKFNIVTTPELEKELEQLAEGMLQGKMNKGSAIKIIVAILKRLGLSFFQRFKALLLAGKVYRKERANVTFFDGVIELFSYLEGKSIPYVIATGSSTKEVRHYFIDNPSDFKRIQSILITRDMISNHKPHPESMKLASKKLNLPLNQLAVIGDLHFDIEMGKQVGATTIGVLTGLLDEEKLQQSEPDFIINKVTDLLDIMEDVRTKIKERLQA